MSDILHRFLVLPPFLMVIIGLFVLGVVFTILKKITKFAIYFIIIAALIFAVAVFL